MARLNRDIGLGLLDPAPSWRWIAEMPSIDGAPNVSKFVIESVTATHPKIPSTGRFGGGTNRYYPQMNDIDGTSMTFYETSEYDATRYLYSWQRLVLHPNGCYGLPKDYKKFMQINLYDNADDSSPKLQVRLNGIWPTDIGSFDLNYTESGRRTVTANFSVDSNEIEGFGGDTYKPVGDVYTSLSEIFRIFS